MVDAPAVIYTLLMLLLTSWHAAAARWTGYLTRAAGSLDRWSSCFHQHVSSVPIFVDFVTIRYDKRSKNLEKVGIRWLHNMVEVEGLVVVQRRSLEENFCSGLHCPEDDRHWPAVEESGGFGSVAAIVPPPSRWSIASCECSVRGNGIMRPLDGALAAPNCFSLPNYHLPSSLPTTASISVTDSPSVHPPLQI
jgi:hypothetical protein